MKANLSRMLRSGLALLLVFCMVAGFVPTMAFATSEGNALGSEGDPNTINYVSIGDSMSNGYGFNGYNQGKKTMTTFLAEQTGMYGTNAYPDQFEKRLGELNNCSVDHTKLALSALRVENLRYLLGITDSEPADGYTAYAGYAGNNVTKEQLREFYQSEMKDADVISLAMGNASFNAFFFDRVMKVFGTIDDWEEGEDCPTLEDALTLVENKEQKQVVRQVYDLMKGKLLAAIPGEMIDTFNVNDLCDLVAYTTASFLLSYEDVIEWIGENNDDAEVILIGVINSTSGLTIEGDGWEFDLGAAMDSVYGAVNAYLAALPTVMQLSGKYENVKFYYADQPANPEMISAKIPALAANNWRDVDGINGALVRDKSISAYNNIIVEEIISKVNSQITDTNETAIADITNSGNQTKTVLALATNGDGFDITKLYGYVSAILYLGLENAVVKSMESSVISLDAIATFANEEALAKVFNDAPMATLDVTKEGYNTTIKEAVDAWTEFFCEENMLNLVRLFAISKVGDGISAHPTVATHNRIAANVIAAYGNHTVQDETIENVEILLTELYKLVETYGPEVAAQVWAQWEEYGYVDMVETSMSELKAMLEERYTYYTETALPAIDASVKNLSAQKDALTAELTALKAELAAKQAELEAVVNGVEIGDIYVPDINIDVELGNNTQTIVPGNDCNVDGDSIEAELEAAVKDIEHAIAVIEALLADIEADIADMIALAEQIAAAVAELEKTMASVAEAAEDVEAAVNAVIDVIKNSDGVVDATVKSFEAARATAEAAVEVLSLTMATAEELMADVDTMIGKIAADAEALYNKFLNDLPGCIDAIPDEAKMLIGGTVLAVQQAYEANKEKIDAALTAELTKLAEEYGINEESVKAELDKLTKEYEASKAAVEAELTAIEAKIAAEVEAKYAEIEAEYNAQIEAAKAEAAAKLAALEEELKGYQAELEALAEDAAEEVKAGIQAQIDRVNADIATVKADLEHAVSHLENAAEAAYNQIVEEVTKIYEETVAALEQKLAELKAAFDEAVAALNQKLAELKAAYDKAVEDLTAAADKAIAELTEALNKALEELGKIGEELADEVNGILSAIRQELADAQKAVEEILKGNLAAIEELKNALIEMGGEAIVDAVNSLIDAVMALIEEATTADLVIDDDFKYVAIGDGSAASESYVDKLTAALNAEAAENGVDEIETVNYAKVGNTVAAERANLSDVSGADLITVGFSNVGFLQNAMAGKVTLDWADLIGEENVQYVDDLMADVDAELNATVITGTEAIDSSVRAKLSYLIEAAAYSAVQYTFELPELINEINAVNPDAVVIIVGMYNPLDGVVFTLGEGTTLDVGEYVNYLVDGVAVHGLAYSILTGNSIYVDARDVATVNTDKELAFLGDIVTDIFNINADLISFVETLYPSAVGDDGIADEIADALNITYVKSEVEVLLGDVNGDGVVDAKDVTRLRKYMADPDTTEINFKNADVNLDGVVDAKDMTRMRKHFADGVAFG